LSKYFIPYSVVQRKVLGKFPTRLSLDSFQLAVQSLEIAWGAERGSPSDYDVTVAPIILGDRREGLNLENSGVYRSTTENSL